MARLLRLAAVVALVGGATAGLSACSGDPEPIVTETPSPTRTEVSESPTPTLTAEEELLAQIPEDARGEDFQSATRFAAFFVREYQQVFLQRDAALFVALSGPECAFCSSAVESLAALEAEGQHRVGGDVTTEEESSVGGLQADETYVVTFAMSTEPTETIDADGDVVSSSSGGSGLAAFSLAYVDGRWMVLGVNLQRSGE